MSYWYYREDKNSELVGPVDFNVAHAGCMYLSKDKTKSGRAEMISILGERPGDPANIKPQLRVERLYERGRIVASGRAAQYFSDTQRPATAGGEQ